VRLKKNVYFKFFLNSDSYKTKPLAESHLTTSNNYTVSSIFTSLASLATGNTNFSTGYFLREKLFDTILKYKVRLLFYMI